MYQGIAGFVLQYKIRETIVYAELNQGDEFGSYAILQQAISENKTVDQIVEEGKPIFRQFSVQAITKISYFKLNIEHLKHMKEHFSEAFQLLFMNSKIIMREVLRLKFQSSLNCEKKEFI